MPRVPSRGGRDPIDLGSKGDEAGARRVRERREEYDFSKGQPNPDAKRLKKRVQGTIEYFKDLSEETRIPYQTLINLYLRDCAASGRRLSVAWRPKRKAESAG